MLAAVNPTTTATTQYRTSFATETVEGENSTECLMFRLLKATACLTPTSEKSIEEWTCASKLQPGQKGTSCTCFRDLRFPQTSSELLVGELSSRLVDLGCNAYSDVSMADLHPSIAQCAVVAAALKVLLFPA